MIQRNGKQVNLSGIIVVLMFLSFSAFGQAKKSRAVNVRVGFSPVISMYAGNEKHSSAVKARPAYCFSARLDIRLAKGLFLQSGAEYFIHGLTFNSYYFSEKHQFLYDKNFIYKYSVQLQELNVPLLIRLAPQSESKKVVSPYVSFGYIMRYIVSSKMQVESAADGVGLFDDNIPFKPEHPFPVPNGSSFLCLAAGLQRNNLTTHKALFAELSFRYALTRFGISEPFTASGLFIRSYHIGITLGYKF